MRANSAMPFGPRWLFTFASRGVPKEAEGPILAIVEDTVLEPAHVAPAERVCVVAGNPSDNRPAPAAKAAPVHDEGCSTSSVEHPIGHFDLLLGCSTGC